MFNPENELFNIETTLVGFMINHREFIPEIMVIFNQIEFEDGLNHSIAKKIIELFKDSKPITLATICTDDLIRKASDVIEVMECYNAPDYKFKEYYLQRFSDLNAEKFVASFSGQEKLKAGKTTDEISKEFSERVLGFHRPVQARKTGDIVLSMIDNYDTKKENEIHTGFEFISSTISILPKKLIVLSGRPKTGKTTFALNMANYIAKSKKVLFFSFEMSAEEILDKLIKLNHNKPINDKNSFAEAGAKYLGSNQHENLKIIENQGLTTYETANILNIERPDIIFIDQLDCIPVITKQSRHDLVLGEIVTELKKMAMEYNIPIVLLHQLNRQAEQSDTPKLSNLKDTGVLEQKADVILMLWPVDIAPNDDDVKYCRSHITLHVVANRMGRTGTMPLEFYKHKSEFKEVTSY